MANELKESNDDSGFEANLANKTTKVKITKDGRYKLKPKPDLELLFQIGPSNGGVGKCIKISMRTNDEGYTRVEFSAINSGTYAFSMEDVVDIQVDIELEVSKESKKSAIQESGEHTDKSCLVLSGTVGASDD